MRQTRNILYIFSFILDTTFIRFAYNVGNCWSTTYESSW